MRSIIVTALAALLAAACQTAAAPEAAPHSDRGGIGLRELAVTASATSIDARRSLAVTETAILAQFPFQDVMERVSGGGRAEALSLYRQLWDTANRGPGLGLGPHCDDELVGGVATRNGFPYQCPRAEGAQVAEEPFAVPVYMPIGLFNRFDLAPADGADCGEYRIVYARNQSPGRNFIIFEGALPNPQPALGLGGCVPVARFWADLSGDPSPSSRATKLRAFYFDGLPGFAPVVRAESYGANDRGAGQIRTNQFMQFNWLLRELKLRRPCAGCVVQALPATTKVNPFGPLFGAAAPGSQAAAFQDALVAQVPSLAVGDLDRFSYLPADSFNSADSDAQAITSSYVDQASPELLARIGDRLAAIGSPLPPRAIVARAQALSCAGCHNLSGSADLGGGLVFPSSLGFVHVSESLVPGPEGQRFRISPALEQVFLPHRKLVLESFLDAHRTCKQVLNCCGALVCIEDADCPVACFPSDPDSA